jgi:dihydropteroate synthase
MASLPKRTWRLGSNLKLGPAPFFIVGVVNNTPDSFYDGGKAYGTEKAVSRAIDLIEQSADVVDLGGESTRPFSERVSSTEELQRVMPVLRHVLSEQPQALISVDTYKAEVAAQVLQNGARIINDVSACRFDPGLRDVLVQFQPGYVLMHSLSRPEDMQSNPRYDDVTDDLLRFFQEHLNALVKAGLAEDNIVLDPGIGFGKTLEHNLTILRNLGQFQQLKRPLFLGLSNKSMWGKLLGLDTGQRQNATQAATALTARKGACIHRVHEVDLTRQTLRVVEALEG